MNTLPYDLVGRVLQVTWVRADGTVDCGSRSRIIGVRLHPDVPGAIMLVVRSTHWFRPSDGTWVRAQQSHIYPRRRLRRDVGDRSGLVRWEELAQVELDADDPCSIADYSRKVILPKGVL